MWAPQRHQSHDDHIGCIELGGPSLDHAEERGAQTKSHPFMSQAIFTRPGLNADSKADTSARPLCTRGPGAADQGCGEDQQEEDPWRVSSNAGILGLRTDFQVVTSQIAT